MKQKFVRKKKKNFTIKVAQVGQIKVMEFTFERASSTRAPSRKLEYPRCKLVCLTTGVAPSGFPEPPRRYEGGMITSIRFTSEKITERFYSKTKQ